MTRQTGREICRAFNKDAGTRTRGAIPVGERFPSLFRVVYSHGIRFWRPPKWASIDVVDLQAQRKAPPISDVDTGGAVSVLLEENSLPRTNRRRLVLAENEVVLGLLFFVVGC